ncbi:MAG TPA: hypothetical protein V6C58_12285, partial [Allocoleopsis sp.]
MTTYKTSERYGSTYQGNSNNNQNDGFWSTFGKIAAGGIIAAALLYQCGPDKSAQVIDNSTTIEQKCCPEKKTEDKSNRQKKNTPSKKRSGIDEKVKDYPSTDKTIKSDDCYKTIKQVLNEPCLTDPKVIYVENGVEYSYTGPGEDIKVDRKLIGKKKVKTHNFTSLDGKYDLQLRADQLNTIDQMYRTKTVKCDETISQVIVPEVKETRKSKQRNRDFVPQYTTPSYTNVAVAVSGRGGALMINSGNMYAMNPMMNPIMMQNMWMGFGNRVVGYAPT